MLTDNDRQEILDQMIQMKQEEIKAKSYLANIKKLFEEFSGIADYKNRPTWFVKQYGDPNTKIQMQRFSEVGQMHEFNKDVMEDIKKHVPAIILLVEKNAEVGKEIISATDSIAATNTKAPFNEAQLKALKAKVAWNERGSQIQQGFLPIYLAIIKTLGDKEGVDIKIPDEYKNQTYEVLNRMEMFKPAGQKQVG